MARGVGIGSPSKASIKQDSERKLDHSTLIGTLVTRPGQPESSGGEDPLGVAGGGEAPI